METVERPGVLRQVARGFVRAAKLALLIVVLGVVALFIWQDKLLWHPRLYARGEVSNFSRRLEPLSFHTPQGWQTGFYAPSRGGLLGDINRAIRTVESPRPTVPGRPIPLRQEHETPLLTLSEQMWTLPTDHDAPRRRAGGSSIGPDSASVEQYVAGAARAPWWEVPAALPMTLWVVFAGNGSLVLDWDDILRGQRDDGAAFLLVDYPGYGYCEGNPSPGAIRDNAAGAMDALARQHGWGDGATLARAMSKDGRRLAVLGQSMGTGPALEFAVDHPEVSRVVLVSPYMSLREASRGVVGWPLCLLLRGNFDNAARLDTLARRVTPPDVFIFHGDEDTLVPIVQGRTLAAAHPGFVRFTLVPGAGHDDTAHLARGEILAALDER